MNPLHRRDFLASLGTGLGGIALATLLAEDASAQAPHHRAKARRVLQVFCPGAVSQLDTFDYKPELVRRHGQPLPGENVVTFQGANGNLMRSPWGWRQHGQCGKHISDLLPHLASCADDICFIHSMVAK